MNTQSQVNRLLYEVVESQDVTRKLDLAEKEFPRISEVKNGFYEIARRAANAIEEFAYRIDNTDFYFTKNVSFLGVSCQVPIVRFLFSVDHQKSQIILHAVDLVLSEDER